MSSENMICAEVKTELTKVVLCHLQTVKEKGFAELCKKLMPNWQNGTCILMWRQFKDKVHFDSVEINGQGKQPPLFRSLQGNSILIRLVHFHFYSSEDQPCRAVLWRNDPGRHPHGKALVLERNMSFMLVSNASIVWSFFEEANWLQNPDSHPGILWRSAHHDHHPDCLCISPSEAMQRKPGMKKTGPKWLFVVGIKFQ